MLGQERDHLASDLKFRDVAVEIDLVQAVDIQGHMASENLIDVNDRNHRILNEPPIPPECTAADRASSVTANQPPRLSEAKPLW